VVGSAVGPGFILAGQRRQNGSVAEWFKALVLKTSVGGTLPWVRIPPLPPLSIENAVFFAVYFGVPAKEPAKGNALGCDASRHGYVTCAFLIASESASSQLYKSPPFVGGLADSLRKAPNILIFNNKLSGSVLSENQQPFGRNNQP
jgi:hypothetical protein